MHVFRCHGTFEGTPETIVVHVVANDHANRNSRNDTATPSCEIFAQGFSGTREREGGASGATNTLESCEYDAQDSESQNPNRPWSGRLVNMAKRWSSKRFPATEE